MKSMDLALVAALALLLATPGCGLLDRCSGDARGSGSTRETKFITPVAEAQLASLLPEVAGLVREAPKTETHTEGKHSLTRASAEYSRQTDNGMSKLKLEITDGTHFQAVNARLAILAHAQGDVQLTPIKVKNQSGFHRVKPDTGSFEVLMVVGNRFLVTLESSQGAGQQDINALLEAIDYVKLEALAKAP